MASETTQSSLDELAKGLATGTLSRGKAIRWMGGALLGAALASVPGVALADDGCRRLGRECRRDSQCCSRNCIRRGDDKVCGCPEGKTRCGVRCVNLETNERHCGECFNRCPEGQECVDGVCGGTPPPCPPEPANCCQCIYTNTTTSEEVSTCQGPFPGDVNACADLCTANVPPPGTELSTTQFYSSSEGFVPGCAPAVGGTTGTRCLFSPCTPPPA